MSPRTKDNLDKAMECAALDYANYCRFAARARMDENWELAREFQQTADTERMEDFARESDLEDLVKTSAENLRTTIEAETRQIETFKQFAKQARDEKEIAAALLFERITREKEQRRARFLHILETMGVHSDLQMVG